ncbi:MAG: ISKra4 family transposase, partial [Planctomycetota bacterium]
MVFAERRNSGSLDLEAVEQATRDALHQAGAGLLGTLLNQHEPAESRRPCGCGGEARYAGRRSKKLVTTLGEVALKRPYYHCSRCGKGFAPRDRELDVEKTQYSPGVRRMAAAVGAETSFDRGRVLLDELAGVRLTGKAVEREAEAIGADVAAREQAEIRRAVQLELLQSGGPEIPILYVEMDGTGVPAAAAARAGRKGRDGAQARTREVKLGCVFTQSSCDEQGRPLRDAEATSYTGAIEDAAAFGRRIWSEARRRGWSRARRKVVIGDGAAWIWNLAHEYFPGAIEIVDLYHAREHLWELAGKLFARDEKRRRSWARRIEKKLDAGRIEQLVAVLRRVET